MRGLELDSVTVPAPLSASIVLSENEEDGAATLPNCVKNKHIKIC